ncbi:MAG: biotin/lipoyl-containing protein, partial [Caldimonas sp.]
GERDCSMQRRHQKIIEEAPSPAVDPALRRRMGEAAVAVARDVGYRGAGTVEFLLDGDGAFWFIEMNTRLQVEHALTEALVGVDLVEWQLRVAAGEPLPLSQADALARFEAGGHAVEARLCAENPGRGFLPQAGRVVRWSAPPNVRCDHALASGCEVNAFYDSMLGKLIAHAPTRAAAVAQLADALDRTVCLGVKTNRAFLARLLRHERFLAAGVTTGFIATHFATDEARAPAAPGWLEALAAAALALLPRAALPDLWTGWSSSPAIDCTVPLAVDGERRRWRLTGTRDDVLVAGAAASHRIVGLASHPAPAGGDDVEAEADGRRVRAACARAGDTGWWLADGHELVVVDERLAARAGAATGAPGDLLAPMHGRVTQVLVVAGAAVEAGALLVVLEAMKMEHQIRAPRAGVVAALHARTGDQVAARQRLVEMAL